jgi:hypothetical protein
LNGYLEWLIWWVVYSVGHSSNLGKLPLLLIFHGFLL